MKRRILVVDIGGSFVKLLMSDRVEREFASGPRMTPKQFVSKFEETVCGWKFDVASIGFPAPVRNGRILRNPKHLDLNLNRIKLRMYNKTRQQRIDQDLSHRGTLAGMLDEKGFLLSIGRIVRIQNGIVRVTTATEERPRIVELGAVILSSRFDEVGYES